MPPNHKDLFDFSEELDVAVGPSGIAPDLYKEIAIARRRISDKLVQGKCKTLESYADAVGFIRAIDYVLDYSERKRLALEAELGTPITDDEGP